MFCANLVRAECCVIWVGIQGMALALPDLIFLSKTTPSTSPPCSRSGLSDPRMMLLHSSLTAPPSSTSYICP